jgi:hypothetical protein
MINPMKQFPNTIPNVPNVNCTSNPTTKSKIRKKDAFYELRTNTASSRDDESNRINLENVKIFNY